jgi:hypothetical protein
MLQFIIVSDYVISNLGIEEVFFFFNFWFYLACWYTFLIYLQLQLFILLFKTLHVST